MMREDVSNVVKKATLHTNVQLLQMLREEDQCLIQDLEEVQVQLVLDQDRDDKLICYNNER